jgi:hypothetical protein
MTGTMQTEEDVTLVTGVVDGDFVVEHFTFVKEFIPLLWGVHGHSVCVWF